MPVPHVSGAFGDLLDIRFQEIFESEKVYYDLQSMLSTLFNFDASNGRNDIRWSQVGTLPDFTEFTGNVNYSSQSQGYDTTATYVEFSSGIQVERKLFDDDQFHIMDQKPRGLSSAAMRTREKHGARILNNAFSVDQFFYVNTEAVALCSDSHTTASGASVATGFDNKITAPLTATAVAAGRIQMVDFRGDQGERISAVPDELWYPVGLYEQAYEIINASGKVDTANNNPNVHKGKYTGYEWNYMTDTNNWFMCDSRMRKQMLHWIDRIPLEFAMVEDFDSLIAKWRGYMRYTEAHHDWRFALGSQVS
jgi:hypothetical protein